MTKKEQLAEEKAQALDRELSADDIRDVNDLRVQEVAVPEWGGKVYVRMLPADESLAMEEEIQALTAKTGAIFVLLAYCLCKSNGERLFADYDDARKTLGKRIADPLVRLQEEAIKLNRMIKGVETAKNA